MYIQEGLSIVAIIAQHLIEAGVPTPNEQHGIGPRRKRSTGVWQPSSLYDLLSNEAYIGTLYYGKRERLPSPNNPDRKMVEKRLALEALNISVLWHPDKPLEIAGSIPADIASNMF